MKRALIGLASVACVAAVLAYGASCSEDESLLFAVSADCNDGKTTVTVGEALTVESSVESVALAPLPTPCEFAWAVDPETMLSTANTTNCSPTNTSKWTATATFVAQRSGTVKVRAKPNLQSDVIPQGKNLCEFTIVDSGNDGGPPPDATVGGDARTADADAVDATMGSADIGPRPDSESCATVRAPIAAAVAPAQPSALICNPLDNLLAEDGQVVGLARSSTNRLFELDGQYMAACVRVDYGAAYWLGEVRLVARGTSPVCGDGCVGATCGTGRVASLYGSLDGTTFSVLGAVAVPGTLANVALPTTGPYRYVLVCRSGFGDARDNLEVDYVEICTF